MKETNNKENKGSIMKTIYSLPPEGLIKGLNQLIFNQLESIAAARPILTQQSIEQLANFAMLALHPTSFILQKVVAAMTNKPFKIDETIKLLDHYQSQISNAFSIPNNSSADEQCIFHNVANAINTLDIISKQLSFREFDDKSIICDSYLPSVRSYLLAVKEYSASLTPETSNHSPFYRSGFAN